jgi:AcrR family transcriptional regulator
MRRTDEHTARRNQLLETASTLFMEEGYETASIQQIIDRVGIAKGTFYHYFSSKEDLLNELIITQARGAISQILPIIDRKDMNAAEKFNAFHRSIGVWKMGNKEMIIAAARTLYRDENLVYRKKLNRASIDIMLDPYTKLIEEGVESGLFDCPYPRDTAELILNSSVAWGEITVPIMLEASEHPEKRTEFEQKLNAFQKAIERILGAEEGVLDLYPPHLIDSFFDT